MAYSFPKPPKPYTGPVCSCEITYPPGFSYRWQITSTCKVHWPKLDFFVKLRVLHNEKAVWIQ